MRNPLLYTLTILVLVPLAMAGAVLISDVATADSTRTRLSLELLGVSQPLASLSIRLAPTRSSAQPVLTTAARTSDGRYLTPAIVMRFAEYRVEVIDPGMQQVITHDILNTATIATVLARVSLCTPVQVRRAPRLADAQRPVGTLRLQPTYDRGASRLHIVLVDDAGVFLDQYLGKPVSLWESRPISSYNVYALGAQYYANGTCRAIPVSSADWQLALPFRCEKAGRGAAVVQRKPVLEPRIR